MATFYGFRKKKKKKLILYKIFLVLFKMPLNYNFLTSIRKSLKSVYNIVLMELKTKMEARNTDS